MGIGWKSAHGSGKGKDAITSGLEGAWTPTPIEWDSGYFETLFGHEWELTKSPAGANQWRPKGGAGANIVPDAHDASKKHAPMMLTTDLALRVDPVYEKISRRFHANPEELADAFTRAWYKLLHRDMGPLSRYLGPWVAPPQLWQDPVPAVDHPLIDANDVAALKGQILSSRLSVSQLVSVAWRSAASFRGTDKRGGATASRPPASSFPWRRRSASPACSTRSACRSSNAASRPWAPRSRRACGRWSRWALRPG
jgi:catalase-peroxidase